MSRLPADWVPPGVRPDDVFTVALALAAGATHAQVRHRIASGAWRRVAGRGLVRADAAEHGATGAQAAWATWPDAVVCRETALRYHLSRLPAELALRPVHAWVPMSRASFAGLVAHRFTLEPQDVLDASGGRVTTRVRAALDTLAGVGPREAQSLLAWLVTRNVVTREDLLGRLSASPGMWGNAQLRRLVELSGTGALSAAERLLHRLLDRAGLTGWVANVAVADGAGVIGRADVLFRAERVVVEVDGRAYHGADRFQADRERNNRLVLAGYTVLHVTWHDLTVRPGAVLDQIREALRRPPRGR